MYENIGSFSLFFNELIGRVEYSGNILVLCVLKLEVEVCQMWGKVEVVAAQ